MRHLLFLLVVVCGAVSAGDAAKSGVLLRYHFKPGEERSYTLSFEMKIADVKGESARAIPDCISRDGVFLKGSVPVFCKVVEAYSNGNALIDQWYGEPSIDFKYYGSGAPIKDMPKGSLTAEATSTGKIVASTAPAQYVQFFGTGGIGSRDASAYFSSLVMTPIELPARAVKEGDRWVIPLSNLLGDPEAKATKEMQQALRAMGINLSQMNLVTKVLDIVETDGQTIVLLKTSTDCKIDLLKAMSGMRAGMGSQQKPAGKFEMSLSLANLLAFNATRGRVASQDFIMEFAMDGDDLVKRQRASMAFQIRERIVPVSLDTARGSGS